MLTIVVERAGKDRFGNPSAPASHQVDECARFPAGTLDRNFERTYLQDTVEWDLDLYAPFDADITSADVVLLPGDTNRYQVQGQPQRWESPDGWQPGTVVRLKAVTG